MVHDDRATGFGEQHVFEAYDAAGWNVILEVHFTWTGIRMHEFYVTHFPTTLADLLDHHSLVGFRHLNGQLLIGLSDPPAVAMQNDLGLRYLNFVAFASHLLDQHAKVQLSTAGDQEPVRTVSLLHPQRDVRFELFEQPLPQVSGCQEPAFTACEGTVVHGKCHLDGRLIDGDAREGQWLLRVGDGVSDADLVQSGDGNDFACFSLLNVDPFKT